MQPPQESQQPPAWHQLNYEPVHTPPSAAAEFQQTLREFVALLAQGAKHLAQACWRTFGQTFWRDVWEEGVLATVRDTRVFLRHPPRWFFVLLIASGIFVVLFFACSMSGAVASQARWLRSLMP